MAVLAGLLTVTSNGYGWHRDELYFRMLPLQWGYVDQPPFAPLLVGAMSSIVDEPWAIRVPATLAAVLATLLAVLIAKEVGGGPFAQGLAAWGYAFGVFPLLAGHLMSTASFDQVAWLAAILFVMRAVWRGEPRWWVAFGATVGLATYNKLLIALLVVSLIVGFAVAGPWRLPWRWVAVGAAVAVALALPALLYQATNDWPQWAMGRALTAKNGAENRVLMWPLLLVLLGPLLVPVWVAGWWSLARRPAWRPLRFLAVALVAVLLLSFAAAGQVYYPLGLVAATYAVGCVPVAEWAAGQRIRRALLAVALLVDAGLAAVISLPLVPLSELGHSGVPALNSTVGDQVGWPAYVGQVAQAYQTLSADERRDGVVVTSNYGEAGAIDRFGPALGLPAAISGHNELFRQARPPDRPVTLLAVGGGALRRAQQNSSCTVLVQLDNGVGVPNEEQGQPVAVCRDAREPWQAVWPQFRHLD